MRPEPVLKKAIEMIRDKIESFGEERGQTEYIFLWEQMKSVRQDLTVQVYSSSSSLSLSLSLSHASVLPTPSPPHARRSASATTLPWRCTRCIRGSA